MTKIYITSNIGEIYQRILFSFLDSPADQHELNKILEDNPYHKNELKQNLLQVSSDQLPSHEIPVADFSTQIGSKIKELIKTAIESKLASSSKHNFPEPQQKNTDENLSPNNDD